MTMLPAMEQPERMDIDPTSELAAKSAERARELVTARLSALRFGSETSDELMSLWSPTLSSVIKDTLGDEAIGLDWVVVERIMYLAAALSYLTAMSLGSIVTGGMQEASEEERRQQALQIWRTISSDLASRKPGEAHF